MNELTANRMLGYQVQHRENPFIEISDSVYLLARLVILTYLFALYMFAFFSREVSPFLGLRLIADTLFVGVFSFPLWYRMKNIGIFHPLYIIAALVFLKSALPNIRLFAVGFDYHPALFSMSANYVSLLHIKSIFLHTLSYACIYIGYSMSQGMSWRFLQIQEKRQVPVFAGAIAFIVGTIALFLLMDLSGGVNDHLKNISRGHANKVWLKDSTFASAYSVLVPLVSLAPAFWILKGKLPYVNPVFWGLTGWSLVAAFLVNGRRSAVVMVILIFVACWILRRRSLAVGRLAIIGLLIYLMMGILGDFRRSNWSSRQEVSFESFTSTDFSTAFTQSVTELESRKRGGAVLPILARVPHDVPYLYGKNYLDYVNRFIPRLIWKNKPRGIGIKCAAVFYNRPDSGGIPPGALGEAYWSGGYLAVVLVFLSWGIILRSIGNFFIRFHHSSIACLLYMATLTKLGPSEPQFRAWLYVVAPITFLMVIFRVFRLASSPKPHHLPSVAPR